MPEMEGSRIVMTKKTESKMDPDRLKRDNPPRRGEAEPEPPSVSAGPVDRVIELAFNPSREKIREVTIIDRMQGRLFPQLDMVNMMLHYCLEVAYYRQDALAYQQVFGKDIPEQPDPLDEFMFRTAQWQKSVAGKNLERATDIALAETEARSEEVEGLGGVEPWKD